MSSLKRLTAEIKAELMEPQPTVLLSKPCELSKPRELSKPCEARADFADHDFEQRVSERTAELSAANARLVQELEQRDVLLREVYHRVKNNLQIVDLLLAMQARQLSDKQAVDALTSVRQRVFAMGLVHRQLTQSTDLRTFDIAHFLQALSKNIIETGAHADVAIRVQSIPMAVGLDFAIPLGLLVTELVTNSLKHAFSEGVGDIFVDLERREGDKIALIVSDNGQSTNSDHSAPFASQPGRGINIITGLVAQLQGAISIETKNGTRTEIVVAAPAQQ